MVAVMRGALVVLVLIVVTAAGARANGDRLSSPVLLRIEGHVGAPRSGDRGLADLTWRRGDTTMRFQVGEIWVLSGDLVGLDVLHEVEPYTPSLSVAGPAPLLDRLAAASPDEPLEISGYFRRGARIL